MCLCACCPWQAHKSELKELQAQLDQAYNDLSELQYSTDQEKAALQDKAQAAEEQLKVSLLHPLCTNITAGRSGL